MTESSSHSHGVSKRVERIWWGTWSLALLAVLGFLWTSYRSDSRSILLTRLAQLRQNADSLRLDFENLERYARLLTLTAAEEAARGKLTQERLSLLQDLAEPHLELYWVEAQGQSKLGPSLPDWTLQRLKTRGDDTELRSLPPGWAAGRHPAGSLSRHPDTPENYLWLVAPVGDGSLIMGRIQLDRVLREWVAKRLSHLPLVGEVRTELTQEERMPPSPNEVAAQAQRFRLTIPTFLPGQQPPFPLLLLELDNGQALKSSASQYLIWLLLTGLIFALLATSLMAYRRGLAREAELAQSRQRFTELISHELRNPVASLKMYSEILGHDLVPEKREAHLAEMERQAERLHRIVENLLSLGSLESAHGKLAAEAVDLRELMVEVVAQRPVELEVELERTVVSGDPQALRQIFENLLNNAFLHGGGTSVAVKIFEAAEELVVRVSDQGPGVPESQRRAIFEPYRQASKGPGVGLGLALVRGLARAHGGEVTLVSTDQGACFEVRLPRGG